MRCPYCSTPMQRDDQFDPICPNGCQRCESRGCHEKVAEGDEVDSCVRHNLIAALDDLQDEPWDMQAQARVARWRTRADGLGIVLDEPCDACGYHICHSNCPDLERNQGFEGYAEQ